MNSLWHGMFIFEHEISLSYLISIFNSIKSEAHLPAVTKLTPSTQRESPVELLMCILSMKCWLVENLCCWFYILDLVI